MIYVRHPRPEDFAPTHVACSNLGALATACMIEFERRRHRGSRSEVRLDRELVLVGSGDERVHVYMRPRSRERVAFEYAETFDVSAHEGNVALGASQWIEPPPTFQGES